MEKKKCANPYLAQQCIAIRSSIQSFKQGLTLASMKDDGKTDKVEAKLIKEVSKELNQLQKTLDSYEYV